MVDIILHKVLIGVLALVCLSSANAAGQLRSGPYTNARGLLSVCAVACWIFVVALA